MSGSEIRVGQDVPTKGELSPARDELADSLPLPLLRFVEALAAVVEERDWAARQRQASDPPGGR